MMNTFNQSPSAAASREDSIGNTTSTTTRNRTRSPVDAQQRKVASPATSLVSTATSASSSSSSLNNNNNNNNNSKEYTEEEALAKIARSSHIPKGDNLTPQEKAKMVDEIFRPKADPRTLWGVSEEEKGSPLAALRLYLDEYCPCTFWWTYHKIKQVLCSWCFILLVIIIYMVHTYGDSTDTFFSSSSSSKKGEDLKTNEHGLSFPRPKLDKRRGSHSLIGNHWDKKKKNKKNGGDDDEDGSNNNNDDDSSSSSSHHFPNGEPGQTMHLSTTQQRKSAKLCDSENDADIAYGKLPIPWIVSHVEIGGLSDVDDFLDEDRFWSYQKESQRLPVEEENENRKKRNNNNHNNNRRTLSPDERRCFLPFGHVRRLLARSRSFATLLEESRVEHAGRDEESPKLEEARRAKEEHRKDHVAKLTKLLFKYAPAWRVLEYTDTKIELERRAKVFVFAITGGNPSVAQRARYAEATWGSRTPIQWFGDQWDPHLRPIVDLHPLYKKDKFKYLTFKVSRIWQVLFNSYYQPPTSSSDNNNNNNNNKKDFSIDWYIRVWDDNYFYEENLYPILYRLPEVRPQTTPLLAGKLGIRHLGPSDAIFPFAGGGAGWYLTAAGLKRFGESIDEMEKWIPKLRARKDIFLPHDMHDEDVFLTAWIGKYRNITCWNIPGVEHVSPGMQAKQRCMSDDALSKLRWDPSSTIFFDYTGKKERYLRAEDTWYVYSKPLIWHYMSPKRLLRLESLLYPERVAVELPSVDSAPGTFVDKPPSGKKKRGCYPGVPETGPLPDRGISIFEKPLPKYMRDPILAGDE